MFLEFDALRNARELGGVDVGGGRRVKPGVLLRTAKLYGISGADVQRLSAQYNIRHIFDFRDRLEADKEPDADIKGAVYHSLPVLPKLPGGPDEDFVNISAERVVELMQSIYRDMAENEVCAGAYREFFRVLLVSNGAAVLWHCTQGKDRTGVAAILLLTALGANEQTAVEEYYRTNTFMTGRLVQLASEGMGEAELAVMRSLLLVMPECLNVYLDSIHEHYGTLGDYLRRVIGLSGQDMSRLRAAYTE